MLQNHLDCNLTTYDIKTNQGNIGLNKTLNRTMKEMLSLKTHILPSATNPEKHTHNLGEECPFCTVINIVL